MVVSLKAAARRHADANGTHADDTPAPKSIRTVDVTIPIANITPSPTNPRKTFDATRLQELADSILAKGLLQRIIVRPTGFVVQAKRQGKGRAGIYADVPVSDYFDLPGHHPNMCFEVVVGERRFRAAQLAGLTTIDASVRELDAKDVLEIQLIENDQREDLDAMERARGYVELIAHHGYTPESLAGKVGKSVSWIRGLLKLPQLPKVAADALAAGEIPVSTANLIARLPSPELREQLAMHVVCGEDYWQPGLDSNDLVSARRDDQTPLSFRETKRLIEDKLFRELKAAPFSRKAVDLVPEAGSCDACPKRTGNAPDDWPGARADVCTDPDCFGRKLLAHGLRQVALAEGDGLEVLSGAAADKLFAGHDRTVLTFSAPYVELAGKCFDDPKCRTYRQLLGKTLAGHVVVAVDPEGNAHHLLPKALAEKTLRTEHGLGSTPPRPGNDSYARENREREAKHKLHKQAAAIANAEVVAKLRGALGFLLNVTPPGVALLRAALVAFVQETSADAVRVVERGRGLKAEGSHKGPRPDGPLVELARSLESARELLYVWVELIAAKESSDWSSSFGPGPTASPFWEAFGVRPEAILKQIATEAKASPKEPRAKKKPKQKAAAAADPDEDDDDEEPEHDLGDPGASVEETSPAFAGMFVGDLRDDWADVAQARADLDRASIGEDHLKRLTKPAKARPVHFAAVGGDMELWVSPGACHQHGHTSWHLLTLRPRADFERIYPGRPVRLEPKAPYANDQERREAYFGVCVVVGKSEEYVIEPPERGMYVTTKQRQAAAPESPIPITVDTTLHYLLADPVRFDDDRALFDRLGMLTIGDVIARRLQLLTAKQRAPLSLADQVGAALSYTPASPLAVATIVAAIADAGLVGVPDASTKLADVHRADAWRSTPIESVELIDLADRDRLLEQIIETLGQLADRLDEGETLGLKKRLVVKLKEHIEVLRSATVEQPRVAETVAKRHAARKCRACGCTDVDCHKCIAKTGHPCVWVEDDLCSACEDERGADAK